MIGFVQLEATFCVMIGFDQFAYLEETFCVMIGFDQFAYLEETICVMTGFDQFAYLEETFCLGVIYSTSKVKETFSPSNSSHLLEWCGPANACTVRQAFTVE